MVDLLYVLITLLFFAACILLIHGCDVLIGEDEAELETSAPRTSDSVTESVSPAKVNS